MLVCKLTKYLFYCVAAVIGHGSCDIEHNISWTQNCAYGYMLPLLNQSNDIAVSSDWHV